MKYIIVLIILAALILAIAIVVTRLLKKVERFSTSLFGTPSLAQGIREQKKILSEQPKSVSGMNTIYEPMIARDFPEFNWREFQTKAENMLKSAFQSITEKDISILSCASDDLKRQIQYEIDNNKASGVNEVYRDIEIHQTVISNYEKKSGTCVITLQSAVGHIHYKECNGRVVYGEKDMKEQTKYAIQLMYVQDASLVNGDHALGLNCPNCGAPVTNLGAKFCEYCGTGITAINMQVWSINSFTEIQSQKI